MEMSFVLGLGREFFSTALLLALPVMGVSLVVGMVVAVFQAVTQLNEPTLNFAPRILASGIILVVLGPWMLNKLFTFAYHLLYNIPVYIK